MVEINGNITTDMVENQGNLTRLMVKMNGSYEMNRITHLPAFVRRSQNQNIAGLTRIFHQKARISFLPMHHFG